MPKTRSRKNIVYLGLITGSVPGIVVYAITGLPSTFWICVAIGLIGIAGASALGAIN